MKLNHYQKEQLKVIQQLEEAIQNKKISFSVVAPIENFETDRRICLTSVFFPSKEFKNKVISEIIQPLKQIEPKHYYYPSSALHLTIKNIRVINYPPHFTKQDIQIADKIFSQIVPKHKTHHVYFNRLLAFPVNLALIGITDKERDELILDLDKALKAAHLPDDKQYLNDKYFFANITLLRFAHPPSKKFLNKVKSLSKKIDFPVVKINQVNLITANAVLKKLKIINQYPLWEKE